ncbi:MAG TPA: acyl carrier protein [Streptosporangiaceae bacterium]|nr:acyl carrier protein [Streptosporangiaceae bacterium]
MTGADAILAALRDMLAGITGRAELAAAPPDTALLGPDGAGLDSLTGTLLLTEVQHRFGVDVAAEDLSLDSLASLGTLAGFIAAHAPR